MPSPQLNVRIPKPLNERLNVYIDESGMSKTEVVFQALSSYLGCTKYFSLGKRVGILESKISRIEMLIQE